MPLYFAYGSNMDVSAMGARCPSSRTVGAARLARHRFFVTTDGYASVVRDPRRTVWGILWDLALSDVPALDRYESLATGLYAKAMVVVLSPLGPRRTLLYVARARRPGGPSPGHMEDIVAAAKARGFPEVYQRELETWLPRRRESLCPESDAARFADRAIAKPLWLGRR